MSIEIRGLNIAIGTKPIVRDVCMGIADGERVGLVGSSGSGKSMIAKALMGLLPDTARISGSIMVGGKQLIGLDDTAMADLRGRYMGMVFQNPAAALNPVMTVAQQVGLPLYLHYDLSLDERLDRVKAMLDKVGLSQDALLKYPHQLSGGQQQRVGIATALDHFAAIHHRRRADHGIGFDHATSDRRPADVAGRRCRRVHAVHHP